MADLLKVDGVDELCLPGVDGLTDPDRAGQWLAALAQIDLLIKAHAPEAIVVAGHQHCAGHPASDGEHLADVQKTAVALKAASGFDGPIHAMMLVYRNDRDWDIKPVAVF